MPHRPRLPVAALILVGALGLTGPARAQSAANAAAAEALYDEGTRLLEAGDFAGACPKLAESFRLDPALGALLALAACRERGGQLASAWVTYLDVVARAKAAGDKERAAAAKERADALAPRLPRLKIELAAEVAALPGLSITRDGQAVDPSVASTAVPVDPGEHVVVVRATGKAPAERRITAAEARSDVVTIERLDAEAAAAPGPAPIPGPGPGPAPTQPPEETASGDGLSGLQITGLITGGVGLVALGVGLGFGAMALGKQSELEDAGYQAEGGACDPGQEAACTTLYDDASSAATLSTILSISGGVLAATGVVLVIVGGDDAPGTEAAHVVVTPALGGLTVRGAL